MKPDKDTIINMHNTHATNLIGIAFLDLKKHKEAILLSIAKGERLDPDNVEEYQKLTKKINKLMDEIYDR